MSRLPFELLLSLRYLRPKRTFVSFITLISVVGVALGVAVLIIVISVMTGFDQQLREKILGFNAHLKIVKRGATLSNYERIAEIVATNPKVRGVAPIVFGPVLVETDSPTGDSQIGAPRVLGISPTADTNVTILPSSITEGTFDIADRGLVIGSQLAESWGLHVGDRLIIYSFRDLNRWKKKSMRSKDGKLHPVEAGDETIPIPPAFEVRGIFEVGYYEYDLDVIVTSLADAQELYDLEHSVHGLMVMLHNAYDAKQVATELSAKLGPEYAVVTWMQENTKILGALVVEKNVMFYLLFFIMIVAALCILSALITFVVQKTREIGMLKALGATDKQVAGLFLSQAAFIGAVGDVLGYGLGMLALAYRNEFLRFMNRWTGMELFPPEIYMFTELPALIIGRDILLICGSAWIVCILGGVIPAWRAGRLQPVEALRYE